VNLGRDRRAIHAAARPGRLSSSQLRSAATASSRSGSAAALRERIGERLGSQLDHVFADAVTEAKATAWNVDPTPAVGDAACSDHAPIIVEIAV
jgi:endonuclease/exonuclease/phosphatase family metal-dependent hydrolase